MFLVVSLSTNRSPPSAPASCCSLSKPIKWPTQISFLIDNQAPFSMAVPSPPITSSPLSNQSRLDGVLVGADSLEPTLFAGIIKQRLLIMKLSHIRPRPCLYPPCRVSSPPPGSLYCCFFPGYFRLCWLPSYGFLHGSPCQNLKIY